MKYTKEQIIDFLRTQKDSFQKEFKVKKGLLPIEWVKLVIE